MNVNTAFVTVRKKVLQIVTANATFHSLTAISDGILPGIVFIMVYDLYMLVAANSESDLPLFPLLHPASKHDSHGFLETYFRFKAFLPDLHVSKWILDSAHDAMPYYLYCRKNGIQPFIDLNEKRGI